jgi:hypothetical protein
MILDIKMFTIIHVAISLLAIASGFIVVFGLISAKRLAGDHNSYEHDRLWIPEGQLTRLDFWRLFFATAKRVVCNRRHTSQRL